MKKPNFLTKILVVIAVFIVLVTLFKMGIQYFESEPPKKVVKHKSILHMDLSGIIMNGKKFLKHLKDYKDDQHIKAILIRINSPGGAVGPSQEIFSELKRFREEIKKPIVCVSTGVIASGAYYAAMACDKLVVAPGALVGSIGVIMEFANLEKLYDWAKVSRYSITSGKFKDSGSEYRAMRDDERALFQDMINEVYAQFKSAVVEGRHLKEELVSEYADGRVMTGAKAVKLGFADKEGTYEDAVRLTAELANLGKDYEIFEIPKKKRSLWDLGDGTEEDPLNSLTQKLSGQAVVDGLIHQVIRADLLNQPLYLMPGFWPEKATDTGAE
ncbi:MAG: signal peptide peptidase SppA [Bdellovibrionaceae bacterium]|nr:signal peptide peptidase SppA [Pseudobdellovibrionaceae bacterium]